MADPEELQVAKIVITRRLSADDGEAGDVVYVRCVPKDLPLIEVVGMLRLAEGIAIDDAWHGDADDES